MSEEIKVTKCPKSIGVARRHIDAGVNFSSAWIPDKTLHLNLKRRWYDLIESDVKKEEYRAITPYFCNKLLLYNGEIKSRKWWTAFFIAPERATGMIQTLLLDGYGGLSFQKFDTNTFQNGMSKTADRFQIEHLGIEIKTGNPDWGAAKGVKYFAIQLGNIIK